MYVPKFMPINIQNPKRNKQYTGHDGWYPYYAGYSSDFVAAIINSAGLKRDSLILDPWNGSGTTTTTANNLGFQTQGYDLNPVMVIAAKACLVNRTDFVSLAPLSQKIIEWADLSDMEFEDEPLTTWFRPLTAIYLRKIEIAIQNALVDGKNYKQIVNAINLDHISTIAAFFYVALFRTINSFLVSFRPTNPTWIKLPKSFRNRKAPSSDVIKDAFNREVRLMLSAVMENEISTQSANSSKIFLASSCDMPAAANTVDLLISSPPYCTRIDYAIATMPELTLLGYSPQTSLDGLRRNLIGSSTVPKKLPAISERWGNTCNIFLENIYTHESKASRSYYYKNHVQYFDSIFNSVIEIERVLKQDAKCAIVIQDSHYKELYNNVPLIFSEMAASVGLELVQQKQFHSSRNMAKRNPEVKKYRTEVTASESVLLFKK